MKGTIDEMMQVEENLLRTLGKKGGFKALQTYHDIKAQMKSGKEVPENQYVAHMINKYKCAYEMTVKEMGL